MISTLIALAARIVSNPLANVFQKKLTQNNVSSLHVNAVTYLLLSMLCLFFALNIHWRLFPSSLWGWALISGFFGAIGNCCLIKALQGGELSVLGPVNSYKSIVAMITGIFLLKEIPDLIGILGIILIIWGSYFVFETQKELPLRVDFTTTFGELLDHTKTAPVITELLAPLAAAAASAEGMSDEYKKLGEQVIREMPLKSLLGQMPGEQVEQLIGQLNCLLVQ